MGDSETVLVAAGDHALCGSVINIVEELELDIVGVAEEAVEAVQLAVSAQPGIAVLAECPPQPWAEFCNYIRLASCACRIILVLDDPDQAAVDAAMLLGVRQVIRSALVATDLPRCISALRALEETKDSEDYIRATDPIRTPRVIVVSGAKGGVGKTTFAVNLGVALSQKDIGSVLIWDAYSQFGDVANALSLPPTRLLAELAEMKEDVDDDMVLSHAIRHESGVDVMLTADKPAPVDLLRETLVDRVIRAIRRRYRFIVIDTPPILHAASTTLFSHCWRLFLVTTLRDVASISDAIKLIKALETRRIRTSVISVVANRVYKGDSVKASEIESLTSVRVVGSIPEDPSVNLANNRGKPIVQVAPNSPALREINRIASEIIVSASSFQATRD